MRRLILLAVALSLPLAAAEPARYMITLKRPARTALIPMVQDAGEFQAHAVRTFQTFNGMAATLSEADVALLRRSPDVVDVTPVVERHILGDTPRGLRAANSGRYDLSQVVPYGLNMVGARDLWPLTRGEGVNVVILDTGIDAEHPELKEIYAGGYNVINGTNLPVDGHGHGTHVAGTIAAVDNSFGIVGVAPKVRLYSVKALTDTGNGTDETVSAGVDWIIQKKREVGGRWIMNLSIGAKDYSILERNAFQRAAEEGILLIAAAGNRNVWETDFPARYSEVLAVGALDESMIRARFSSYGQNLAVMAPGVRVLSSYPRGSVDFADVYIDPDNIFSSSVIAGSPNPSHIEAPIVFAGLCQPEDFPAGMTGKIALCERGVLEFRAKAKNASVAGARAIIVYNVTAEQEATGSANWTYYACTGGTEVCEEDKDIKWLAGLALSKDAGAVLRAKVASQPLGIARVGKDDYTVLSGTSMAAPHTVGVAALLWSLAPTATPEQIKMALKMSAKDLGAKGFDDSYGFGLIDAVAAAKYLAPGVFGLPPRTGTNRRRSQGH